MTGDADGERSSAAVHVTALYERQRVHLVRLATAITLDRVVAAEVVEEAMASLQRRIKRVRDPAAHLQRAVLDASASAGLERGRGLSTRRRRRLVARRPHLVEPVVQDPATSAVWYSLVSLSRADRAVMTLRMWLGLDESDVAAALGWSRRRVATVLRSALDFVTHATGLSGADLDRRLIETFAVVMPQLEPDDPIEDPAEDAISADDGDGVPGERIEGDRVHGGQLHGGQRHGGQLLDGSHGRTTLRLFVPAEPKRHRLAWASVAVVTAAATLGAVAIVSNRQDEALERTPDTASALEGVMTPRWYDMIRPYVPETFDRLALVHLSDRQIRYAAVDTDTGRLLDISITRRRTDDGTTSSVPGAETSGPSLSPSSGTGAVASSADGSVVRIVANGGTASAGVVDGGSGAGHPPAGESSGSVDATTGATGLRGGAGTSGPAATDEGTTLGGTTVDGQSVTTPIHAGAPIGSGPAAEIGIDEVARAVARGFDVGEVGSDFGSPATGSIDVETITSVVAEVLDAPRSTVTQPAGRTVADGDVDGERTELAEVGTAAGSLLVVHGIFPAPAETQHTGSEAGGIAVVVEVRPDGTLIRASAASDALAGELLDAMPADTTRS